MCLLYVACTAWYICRKVYLYTAFMVLQFTPGTVFMKSQPYMVRHVYIGIIMSPAKILYWTIDKTNVDNVSCSVYNIKKLQLWFNTLRPRQDGGHFPDDVFKCIFLNENAWISIKISLRFVPKGPINNILALIQIMAWRRPGDKPLSEPMMVKLPTHICVTRPQWVK